MENSLLKILIVDDSPLVAPRVKSMLDTLDPLPIIGESINAEEAIQMMDDVVPDVVLLDLNMPGKNGLALLKEIKSKHPHVAVIVFTNHDEPYYRDMCKELGADYFLDKSTEFDRLPAALQEITCHAV